MKVTKSDLVIIGAGPVGLMCAHLAYLCDLSFIILDKSDQPLEVGRADALNARTLQLFEVAKIFKEIYPLGKPCNTSSVWSNGNFISRQSTWWEELEGCLHKHFLMLGQSHIEKLLDLKLKEVNLSVLRSTIAENIEIEKDLCITTLANGEKLHSKFVIGADGPRSLVRNHFKIPFEITRPQIIWAVIDGIIETDFPKVNEIIVFQVDTSDVAWIPREGNLDRFYVRMDTSNFTIEDAIFKINRAIKPHTLGFKVIEWYSQFTVKESVAEKFFLHDKIFLAGDACHIHSVNGGQGLNTGIGDAFNLIWKINMVKNHGFSKKLLQSYQLERKPVAKSVIESSGELVRSTVHSENGTHALDYVKIVEKRAGNITGMGIRYNENGLVGLRLFDFEIEILESNLIVKTRIYSLLNYNQFTLFNFSENDYDFNLPKFIKIIKIHSNFSIYKNQAILVRPDSYIENSLSLENLASDFSIANFFLSNLECIKNE